MPRVALLVVAMAVMVGSAPAAAAQPRGSAIVEVNRGTLEDDFIESDLCSFDVRVVHSGSFHARVREGRGIHAQAFFLHNNFSFTETLSANGRHVTVSVRRTFNEVRAVPLGGGVFQFHDIVAGRLAVRDSDGRLLGHEAGVIRSTYTFDTLNDDKPGGQIIGEVDRTFHGRFDDVDAIICAALTPPT